jgi:hypothetical protein
MSGADVVRLRSQLLELTERLIRENRDALAAGAVIRAVAAARDELRSAGVLNGLVPAVEARARQRLQNQLHLRGA